MEKIKLKKTDFEISRIGLGTNAVGGHNLYSALDEEQGRALVREALSRGITFFDTADAYGLGRSEELLGEELRCRRQEVIIATKGAIQNGSDGSRKINNRPDYLRAALEGSLKRLSTDYVDLYYIHYVDPEVPLAESVGALERLKEEGKIRAIGLSNATPDQLKEANRSGLINAYQGPTICSSAKQRKSCFLIASKQALLSCLMVRWLLESLEANIDLSSNCLQRTGEIKWLYFMKFSLKKICTGFQDSR